MKTAMILAAGRGERLRPLTDHIPKALCVIHGQSVLEHHLNNLVRAGFTKVCINHAYLGGQIRQHLGDGARFNIEVCYAPEPPGGLETGGGIVNALPLLGHEPFLVINADIYTDYPLATIQISSTRHAHLVLIKAQNYKQTGDFGLTKTHDIDNTQHEFIFSGIAVYTPEFFAGQIPGRYSVTPLLRQSAAQNLVSGEVYHGAWFDIGSPCRLQNAQESLGSS